MKHISLIAGVLLVAAPLTMILPGCGGGNDGGIINPTPFPSATSTATSQTATPTTPSTTGQSSTFELSSGQIATLNYLISGNRITGTLVVPNDASGAFRVRQAVIAFPKGSYNVNGTFTSPRGYSVSGTTSEGPFTLSGQLPTTTQTGTFSLTYFGRTDSGTLPKQTSPTPTARPTSTTNPTATATARPTSTTRPTATATVRATATPRPTATARPTSTALPTATPVTGFTPFPTPTPPNV